MRYRFETAVGMITGNANAKFLPGRQLNSNVQEEWVCYEEHKRNE